MGSDGDGGREPRASRISVSAHIEHGSEFLDAVIDAIVEGIPVGRAGEPDELGPLAVYLASPASAFMTGASLVIDGGYTLW